MDTICQKCKSKFKIPDEKLPEGKIINIPCPKCKGNISIDTRKVPIESPADIDKDSHGLDLSEKGGSDTKKEPAPSESDDGIESELFGEDVKSAFICDDNLSHQEQLQSALKELGYRAIIGKDPNDVLKNLRINHYDIIILHEEFGGGSPSQNPILNYIQPMPISTRRNIFFALIGKTFSTLDNMMAFSKSANTVINEKDLPQIYTILKKTIAENEGFYKIYKETMKELGKR
ncbi:MAG: zinc-ribbon domain-containing protein [Thermodesulfobacteriota bacterium]|nr:zinc-ribbon domain-containing protein [Thermodesulfobacteriota bacterium]